MKKIAFTKMSGAGNDFVMIDNRESTLALQPSDIARLCDRHFGIGADGLLLVEPPQSQQADFTMRYYNSDGSEADMCGNGARCFAAFARRVADRKEEPIYFDTRAGLIRADFAGPLVTVSLTPPQDLKLGLKIQLKEGEHEIHHCNTGVPHAVLFVDDADKAYVDGMGREIRYHADHAPKGTNVNFAQVTGSDALRVRTYERGVEGETLACGTGVTASAIIACKVKGLIPPVRVKVWGGDELIVDFEEEHGTFGKVTLSGPATMVFEGTTVL